MHVKSCALLLLLIAITACDQGLLRPAPVAGDIAEIQRRADAAYQGADWKTAQEDYETLTIKIPAEFEYWFRLGNVYTKTGQLDAAVAAYREALVRNTKSSKAWHNLGIVQLRQATNTFIEMVQYTEESDPLNQRARYIVNAMTNLMEGGYEGGEKQ